MTHMDQYIIPAGNVAEAAPGVARLDAKAINRKEDRSLYAGRQKVYPKLAHGRFRAIKWLVMAVTLGIYYALPWLRWHRGPDLPDQAVLLDMANNRFFFFFLEIWPQEFYFVTGLLVLGGAVAVPRDFGRRPRLVRLHLPADGVDRSHGRGRSASGRATATRASLSIRRPWGPVKIFKKGMTHLSWLAIGLATGGAFVFYFRDAPTLAGELLTGTAPAIAYLFIGIFTLTTYVLGGIAREQVCIYMCPWPRIQGAMIDHETLLVSYKPHRGEPRGPHKKGQPWEGRGDCIDCKACVAVCPTGIDIRDGSQLECIQCALCIDACNDIMGKVGRPRGLIAYDTIAGQEAAAKGACCAAADHAHAHAAVRRADLPGRRHHAGGVAQSHARSRSTCCTTAIRPTCCCPTAACATAIRSRSSTSCTSRASSLSPCAGLEQARLAVVGVDEGSPIRVTTDALRELRVLVTVPPGALARLEGAGTSFALVVRDLASGQETARTTQFQKPGHVPGNAPGRSP